MTTFEHFIGTYVGSHASCSNYCFSSPEILLSTISKYLLSPQGSTTGDASAGSVSGRNLTPSSDTPSRPPRKKKRDGEAGAGDSVARRRSVRRARSVRRTPTSVSRSDTARSRTKPAVSVRTAGSVRRRSSLRKTGSVKKTAAMKTKTISGEPKGKERGAGDIYTKVAIPRSKSFMNVSGQYNLQELFKELREKEGIESVDDILREVISSGGMSFNNIKPVYREMLMKLVMTMSKDEIFIRSQNIMNEQKKKTKGKPWPNFGSKAAKEAKLLKNPPKQIKGLQQQQTLLQQQLQQQQQQKKKINKADIGNPVPISVPKKFAVRVEDLLEGVEVVNNNNNNNNSSSVEKKAGKQEDPYTSCSECGYQSLCGSYCSCSSVAGTVRGHGAKPGPATHTATSATDSSGCSSCECSSCREQGDVCYSCSLYNESSAAGTVRGAPDTPHSAARSAQLHLAAPDSPLTAWRNNMMKTADPEDKREMMAGMSSSAIPQKRTASQQVPPKLAQQLTKPLASATTTKSARRQFRESMREIAGAGDSSSDCSSLPRAPRHAQRSLTVGSRDKARPGSGSAAGTSQRLSVAEPRSSDGFFHNPEVEAGGQGEARTVVSSVSGHAKRPGSGTIKSQGSLSIDSLSGSSSFSQKIAFSETNMQSSLGYLP